jgi:hypothetical protein
MSLARCSHKRTKGSNDRRQHPTRDANAGFAEQIVPNFLQVLLRFCRQNIADSSNVSFTFDFIQRGQQPIRKSITIHHLTALRLRQASFELSCDFLPRAVFGLNLRLLNKRGELIVLVHKAPQENINRQALRLSTRLDSQLQVGRDFHMNYFLSSG